MCRVTRTNGSVRCVQCPPHSNWPHVHAMFQWTSAEKKEVTTACGDSKPKAGTHCSTTLQQSLQVRGRTGSVYVKKRFKSGMTTFSRKKRQPNPHAWRPSGHILCHNTWFAQVISKSRQLNGHSQVSLKRAAEPSHFCTILFNTQISKTMQQKLAAWYQNKSLRLGKSFTVN